MRTLNFNSKGFAVGKTVTAIKEYKQGIIHIAVGDKGKVEKIAVESFPDLLMFNLRIIYMKFEKAEIGMGESVAEEYFKV